VQTKQVGVSLGTSSEWVRDGGVERRTLKSESERDEEDGDGSEGLVEENELRSALAVCLTA